MVKIADGIRTFRCPSCDEYINDSMDSCKFCNTALDNANLSSLVEKQDNLNSAFNAANNLQIMAITAIIPMVLTLLPFIGIFALFGYLALIVILPVKLILWKTKFSNIVTDDKDYKTAKSFWRNALIIWAVLLMILIVNLAFRMI
ncbi:MAG: hypothetical protein HKN25_00335 [Pyrinomonadaceae bacterium]|nr:hypothetical protein [Pyrinomonadaceae bacterium]